MEFFKKCQFGFSFQVCINFSLILFFLFQYHSENTNYCFLFPYVVVFLISTILVTNHFSGIYYTSTYSLFLSSFSLFICGRFFAYILNHDLSLYNMIFFENYTLDSLGSLKLITYLILGVCFLDLGYKLSFHKRISFITIGLNHNWMRKLCLFTLIVSPVMLLDMVGNIGSAMHHHYLSTKLWQTRNYSFPMVSLIQTLFYIGFGYSMAFSYKKVWFISILLFMVISSLFIGARGPIATMILFVIWFFGKNGTVKFSFKRTIAIAVTLLLSIFLLTLFIKFFSFRSIYKKEDIALLSLLAKFLYEQGISLMVFDLSMKVENYPVLAYLQTIFPGASAIASLFGPVPVYSTGFAHALAHSLNPKLFSQGLGTDWTLFSDFYVFGGKSLTGFSIIAFLFGMGMSTLQNSTNKDFWYVLLVALFMRLMFLPRSTLSSIIPFTIYFFIFVVILCGIFSNVKRKCA